jgi:hypothetical protein
MIKINLEKAEEMVRNPRPGGAIAEGINFGIDFSLNLKKLSLTPDQRVKELQRGMMQVEQIRGIGVKVTSKKVVK